MTSERSKRRDFLSLIFIAKSISKKLLINANYASLFARELEKLLVTDKITILCETKIRLQSIISNFTNNKYQL